MSFDLEIAARTIFGEARGESRQGKIAVAYTILNRFNSKRWYGGTTLTQVCMRPFQYSAWNWYDTNLMKMLGLKDDDLQLADCRNVMQLVLDGSVDDPTEGGTHYHDSSISAPSWTNGATLTAMIGTLSFYKNVS